MPAGATLVWEQACGGGYGDPFERDPTAVLHDWREELVSAESAERDYGVVIDVAADAVDAEADRAAPVGSLIHEERRARAHQVHRPVPVRRGRSRQPRRPAAGRAAHAGRRLRVRARPQLLPQRRQRRTSCSSSTCTSPRPGFASEDEGYDAVVMDTVSDSGLAALRSRLSIPVLGPGLVQQHVAAMLGKRFSILTMWERWRPLYEKTMAEYGTRHYCASIRSIGKRPDQEQLLAGRGGDRLRCARARGARRDRGGPRRRDPHRLDDDAPVRRAPAARRSASP